MTKIYYEKISGVHFLDFQENEHLIVVEHHNATMVISSYSREGFTIAILRKVFNVVELTEGNKTYAEMTALVKLIEKKDRHEYQNITKTITH